MAKFLCVCLSSTIQRTVSFKNLELENVNRSTHYRQDASGKAINSARVLNQLENGSVMCVCPLGEKNKDLFMELAQNDNLEIEYVTVPGFTRECWTLLNRLDNTTTEIVVGEPVFDDEIKDREAKILSLIENNLKDSEGVLIAGSRPAFFSDGIIPYIAKMAKENGKILLADYHGEDLKRTLETCTPDIVKINEEEFLETFGYPSFMKEDDLKTVITEKSLEYKNIFVVTRGTNSTMAAENGSYEEFPIEKVVPVNTTACGDSFSAGFLFEFVNSRKLTDSLAKGTWCAARNAERETPGTIK